MYTISEVQLANSKREGYASKAKTLANAKREASRKQCFQEAILKIYKGHTLVAVKSEGVWTTF